MLCWKHVLTKKLWKFRISFRQWSVAYVRKRKLSEARIFPKAEFFRIFTECTEVYRMYRSVDWTHDMTILSEYLPNVPKCGLNTRHDNREVTLSANFALWQMRHRFDPHKRVNDYQRYSMLTVLPLRSMFCTLGNSSSLEAAGDDHSCRYYHLLIAKKDIFWKIFCVSDDHKCYDENMS